MLINIINQYVILYNRNISILIKLKRTEKKKKWRFVREINHPNVSGLATFVQGQFIKRRGVKICFMGENEHKTQEKKRKKDVKPSKHRRDETNVTFYG